MNSADFELNRENRLRLLKGVPLFEVDAFPQESEFQLAYQRLEYLYEISKRLTGFQSIDETFPEILTLVKNTFSISSAVLVEKRGGVVRTVIWPTSGLTDDHIDRALKTARASFSYLTDSTTAEAAALQAELATKGHVLGGEILPALQDASDYNVLFPLLVDRDPVFGVIQLEGTEPLAESDLKFVDALANLIAVALDRHFRVKQELETARRAEQNAISQRNESRDFVTELEAERALREKFVHTLSHDLRTPLTAVIMSAQILARSKALVPRDLQLILKVISGTKRINQMIEALLDANRLKAGEKLPLEIERCCLREIVESVTEELREMSGHRIQFECIGEMDGYWDCDSFRRVSENLVGNAIKYGHTEAPIVVRLEKSSNGPILSVHNEGNAISPEDQKSLFRQFRRTESAQRGNNAGWGLGLTLVRGISEAHGGKTWVESSPEAGTTFFVQIPYDSRPFRDQMK